MANLENSNSQNKKLAYVASLEEAYGAPSQAGFGSAVFFEQGVQNSDLEAMAKKYYQHFVGDLWERWGAEAWMSPWKRVYARKPGAKPEIVKELRAIDDRDVSQSVPMVLDVIEDAEAARNALAGAYDAPSIVDLQVFNIGDGEAMSGMLIAGRRGNGEATMLVFLMD